MINIGKIKQTIIFLVLLLLALITFSNISCIRKVEKVSFTTSKNAWSIPTILAYKLGYFKEEGLDVTLNYVQAAKFSMDALVSGTSDFSNVVETNVSFLGFTGNKNVEVIATICESYDGAIVGRASSGIKKPEDLRGKKLGILQGTTSQIFAERFLKKYNLDPQKVKVINLTPVAIQASMLNKEIDAGSVWQPFTYNIKKALGDDAVVFSDAEVYTGYMNLAVRKDWAETHRDTINKFLQAVIKAERYLKEHKAEAIKLMSEELNLGAEIMEAIWDNYRWEIYLNPDVLLKNIGKEGEWIHRAQPGFENKPVPDYNGYVNIDFLKQIDPNRIKM